MKLAATLLMACSLHGCASYYAGELATQALAKCHETAAIEFTGGRLLDSASTRIDCLPAR